MNADVYEVIEEATSREEAIALSRFKIGTAAVVCGVKVQSNGKGWIVIPEFAIINNLATNPQLPPTKEDEPAPPSMNFSTARVNSNGRRDNPPPRSY